MEWKETVRFNSLLDFLLNIDQELQQAVEAKGPVIYLIVFLIIFCETGLIVFAILPGDTLLFAAGSLAAVGILDPLIVFALLPLAAFAGDQANYLLGNLLGRRLFRLEVPFFNQKNLNKACRYYSRNGKRTIVIGRFIPVVRSLAPFAAALADMKYASFVLYSIIGSGLWSLLFLMLGFFFGQMKVVKENLYLIIIAVAVLSAVPALFSLMNKKESTEA